MIKGDYNQDDYGSLPQPPNQQGFGSVNNYQANSNMKGQSFPPDYRGAEQSNYGQQMPFYNRPSSIPGSPAQSTPAIAGLSEEDIAIFRETQKNIMSTRFLPMAVIGCGALFMAHRAKLFKSSFWNYGIYLCATSYITQLSGRNELRRRIAESSSMSPFAQQVRLQLGHVNKQSDGSFVDESFDPNYFSGSNATGTGISTPSSKPSSSPYYSPYNRYHKQKQNEFANEFDSEEKDLTEFPSDSRNRNSTEFAPDDIVAGDTGFRTRRVVDPVDKSERSRLTYEELRVRNRSQYSNPPGSSPSYMQPGQPMNNNQPDM